MRRTTRAFACCAAACAAAMATTAGAAEAPLRIALLVASGDATSADVAYGVSLAVAASNDAKAAGAKRPTVELLQVNAGDSQMTSLAVEKAAKDKFAGVVASLSEAVAPAVEIVARKQKLALVHVGAGGPTRTLDPADPVFRVDVPPADAALEIAEWLRLKTAKSIGVPKETKSAALFIDGSDWARATMTSLRADDVEGLVAKNESMIVGGPAAGVAIVVNPPAGSDRIVLLGGAGLAAGARESLGEMPVLALDVHMSDAELTKRAKTAFLCATPAWAEERHVDEIVAKHPPAAGRRTTPIAVRAYVAAAALIDAALHADKRGVPAALRDLREGSGAREWPLFDGTGSVDHWRWSISASSADGAPAPIKPAWLPDGALGPFLGGKPGARYRAAPGGVCVRVGFGGDALTPRTIDADLATIGLDPAAGDVFKSACDQILARTCGKLSRVWSRHYDGSARPLLSWKIAFVPEGADTSGASAVWDAVVAGDGPDGTHGGQNFPKERRAQALATYLLRNAKLLHDAALAPPLCAADAVYLNGSYAWNESAESNARSDKIRALLDGCASTFCMKLSKELGGLAGLAVDFSGEPRSIMVAKGGEGVSDEFAYFPPAFAKVLEKTLGRVGAEGK